MGSSKGGVNILTTSGEMRMNKNTISVLHTMLSTKMGATVFTCLNINMINVPVETSHRSFNGRVLKFIKQWSDVFVRRNFGNCYNRFLSEQQPTTEICNIS